MARTGVTETQVAAAADQLLLAGERPTIERVRAVLGTGSPSTLIRHLDAWWRDLGRRLADKQRQVAIPNAPDTVTDLASALWYAALQAAQAQAEATLASHSHRVREDEKALQAERITLAQANQARQTAVAEATAACEQALAQAQSLAHQLQVETERRIRAETQADSAATAKDSLASRLEQMQQAAADATHLAAQERAQLVAHAEAVENRTALEIDRLRQAVKVLQKEMQASTREAKARIAVAEKATQAAQREAAASNALAGAFEKQLNQLPAALQSALRPVARRSRSSSKTPQPGSAKGKPIRQSRKLP